jgi:hypothetical protein
MDGLRAAGEARLGELLAQGDDLVLEPIRDLRR